MLSRRKSSTTVSKNEIVDKKLKIEKSKINVQLQNGTQNSTETKETKNMNQNMNQTMNQEEEEMEFQDETAENENEEMELVVDHNQTTTKVVVDEASGATFMELSDDSEEESDDDDDLELVAEVKNVSAKTSKWDLVKKSVLKKKSKTDVRVLAALDACVASSKR